MLRKDLYELLNRLRFGGTSFERNEALRELMIKEREKRIESEDLLPLLREKETVFVIYAIGALGRLTPKESVSGLLSLFRSSSNPFILVALLETFAAFKTDDFVDDVIKKIEQPRRKRIGKLKKSGSTLDHVFSGDTIVDQILVPSLKYLQLAGKKGIEKNIIKYLDNEDSNIRWNTLVVFDKLNLPLNAKTLKKMEQSDTNALIREQASIMLEKAKREGRGPLS